MADESLHEELARLRTENARLHEERRELHPEHRAKLDSGLSRVASHANREGSEYRMMQAGAEPNGGEIFDSAYQAADLLIMDWGLQ